MLEYCLPMRQPHWVYSQCLQLCDDILERVLSQGKEENNVHFCLLIRVSHFPLEILLSLNVLSPLRF